jgi:predicted nucleic acid-binding protein
MAAVIYPDTNVLVTFLARKRDPGYPAAVAAFAGETIVVTSTVLLETEWVLRSAFGLPKADIAEKLARLVSLPNVELEPDDKLKRALGWAGQGMDAADALHLAFTPDGCRFVTFDRALARAARSLSDAPRVELLQEPAP